MSLGIKSKNDTSAIYVKGVFGYIASKNAGIPQNLLVLGFSPKCYLHFSSEKFLRKPCFLSLVFWDQYRSQKIDMHRKLTFNLCH